MSEDMKIAIGIENPIAIDILSNLKSLGHTPLLFNPTNIQSYFIENKGLEEYTVNLKNKCTDDINKLDEINRRDIFIDFQTRVKNKKIENVASKYCQYKNELSNNCIDIGIFGNDLKIGSVAARNSDIEEYYLEYGYMPNTLQINSEGVNKNSGISQLDYNDILQLKPDWKGANNYDLKDYSPYCMQRRDWTKLYFRKFSLDKLKDVKKSYRLIKKFMGEVSPDVGGNIVDQELPDEYIFVPFQVHDDTQVLYNTPIIDSMREFLEGICAAVDYLNIDKKIVVKEHPKDIGRVDYSDLESKFSQVVWLKHYPISEAITGADLVITLNSSVGYQSLSKYKPVITMGKSLYNSAPNVNYNPDPHTLPKAVKCMQEMDVNRDKVDLYVKKVNNSTFVNGDYHMYGSGTIADITSYIFESPLPEETLSS